MNGWKQWSEQVSTSPFLEKKAAESLAREGLEGFQALGKDEVTSSNLVISSMKPMSVLLIGLFVSRKFLPDPLSFRAGLRYNDFMIYLPSVCPTKRRKHL